MNACREVTIAAAPHSVLHLRRYARNGTLVRMCTGSPINAGGKTRFANLPKDATCARCREKAAKDLSR